MGKVGAQRFNVDLLPHRRPPAPIAGVPHLKVSLMSPPCISGDAFKTVMRRFAACVNVITCVDGETMNGMTATAVCSVTADPPSILIIVNRSNRSHPLISRSGVFAINVLSSEQEELATHFASKAEDPFSTVDHRIGETGCPIICEADAYCECEVVTATDFATHTIFIGKIVASGADTKPPLVYHEGRFCSLQNRTPSYA